MRLGVFGGTFDPPHVGHLLAASDAFEHLALDRLLFVPAAVQPLKTGRRAAPPADRLSMVRLAVAGDSRFDVDSVEIDRDGLSYTVDTLASFAGRYPSAERFLLVGADVLSTFVQWREPERVLRLATLAVLTREARDEVLSGPGGEHAHPGLERWRADLGGGNEHPPVTVPTRRIDVSSTEIRERVRAGKSIRGFVVEAVAGYISSHGLYR